MEQRLQLYINNAEAMQSHLKEYGDEIERGNAAIEKLSTENRSLRDKIKLKSEVIRKQVKNYSNVDGREDSVSNAVFL